MGIRKCIGQVGLPNPRPEENESLVCDFRDKTPFVYTDAILILFPLLNQVLDTFFVSFHAKNERGGCFTKFLFKKNVHLCNFQKGALG